MRSGVLLGCDAATRSRALALSTRHEGHLHFICRGMAAQKVRDLLLPSPSLKQLILVFWQLPGTYVRLARMKIDLNPT